MGAKKKLSGHLSGRGAAQPAVETPFCLQTLQGERITLKTVKEMGQGERGGLLIVPSSTELYHRKVLGKGLLGVF